jgi:hypothetical protein
MQGCFFICVFCIFAVWLNNKIMDDEVYEIDISKAPKENYTKVYKPNGELLVETNDFLLLTWIRAEIKEHNLSGYYVVVGNEKSSITNKGRFEKWVPGMTGDMFDIQLDRILL